MVNPINKAVQAIKQNFIQPGGPMDKAALEWLRDTVHYKKRAELYIVDVGFDVSTHAQRTQDAYNPNDYTTIADFLQEATGNTVATFLSGSGFAAETWEDETQYLYVDTLTSWLKTKGLYASLVDEYDMIDDAFWDETCLHEADYLTWLERFRSLPFPRGLMTHKATN